MQDIVVAQIQRNVPDAFHARLVIALGVGVKEQVAAFDIVPADGNALFDLGARRHVQQDPRALIEDILHERGAVELGHGEALEHVALAVVQTRRAVDVGHAQKL